MHPKCQYEVWLTIANNVISINMMLEYFPTINIKESITVLLINIFANVRMTSKPLEDKRLVIKSRDINFY